MLPLVYYKIWIAIIFHERVNIILLVSTGYRDERERLGDGTVSASFTKIGKKTPLSNLVNNVEEQCKVKHLYLANEGMIAQLLKERTFIEFFE